MMRRFVVLELNPADAHISAVKVDDGVHLPGSAMLLWKSRALSALARYRKRPHRRAEQRDELALKGK